MAVKPFTENTLLKALFDNALTPIAYMDLDFNFIHVNQAYALADEKETDFFPGKNHFDLYPNAENQKIFNEVISTGKPYSTKTKAFEYVDVPERGETFWDWSLTLIKDNQGKDCGILLQLINVTREITVEQKLYEKIKKELHDYDEELETIIETRTQLLQEAITSLQAEKNECVKTEALMLKAKEEAEKANVSKSQFLSRMSHELRTPLNAILGFSQLLNINNLDEKQTSYNDEIILAGKHLLSMISDILDLSRIEEGQFPLSISDVSLTRITLESIALVKHKVSFRNVAIHNLTPENDEISIRCDETRLKEVLVNLLTNAVKYNSDNGLVSVGYKRLENNFIRIYVSDTGKGLSDKDQANIFEPFNRLGAEYTDIEGVGIGLTIAKKLMNMMGGSIGLESERGRGSTFYIDCPIGLCVGEVIKETTSDYIKVDLDDSKSAYKILYVEDNKSNQKMIESLLFEYTNFNLIVADTAETALNEIKNNHFDLIIMDINLPGMDGYAALEKLQLNAETKDIPVIALSASASEDNVKKGLKAGFNRYITKPVMLPELISVINSELNRAEKH